MLKIVKSDKDAYITNKLVQGTRKISSNVGAAGTLDLFKLYGVTFSGSTPNTELSRILVHFDLSDIRSLIQQGKIDTSDQSFWCKLRLKDVYGGQPTPVNFSVSVFPLSSSFDEGIGRDVSYYSDNDICNWQTSSLGVAWFVTGSGLACHAQGSQGDYITSSFSLASTESVQTFINGTEDLFVDVTKVVSATLSGEIPDCGFRITLKDELETNDKTYFVKRFASRQAFDESKHPCLIIGFDDSIEDDTQNLVFDSPCTLSLYNYSGNSPKNIVSGSNLLQVTGSNSIILELSTPISGGNYSLYFTGSQFALGENYVTGVYQTTFTIASSDFVIKNKLNQSGSVEFTPIWSSLDGSVTYITGSKVSIFPQERRSSRSLKRYVVNVHDVMQSYSTDEEVFVRVNIFDQSSPMIKAVKLPVNLPGVVLKNVYYQIRDVATGEIVIPFDELKNSTKVSSDSSGMFFKFYTSCLIHGRSYVIDIMIDHNNTKTNYLNASPVFRIERSS